MKNKLLITAFIISNCIFIPTKPIGNKTALSLSALAGIGLGTITYVSKVGLEAAIYNGLYKKNCNVADQIMTNVKISSSVGSFGSALTYALLYKYTPQARYNKALGLFDQIKNYPLINEKLTKENQSHLFKKAGLLKPGLNIPFIEACKDLELVETKIEEVEILLGKALADASQGTVLEKQINDFVQEIDEKKDVLTHNLGYIKLQDQKLYADLLKADATLQQAHAQQQSANALNTVANTQISHEVRGWTSFILGIPKNIAGGIRQLILG